MLLAQRNNAIVLLTVLALGLGGMIEVLSTSVAGQPIAKKQVAVPSTKAVRAAPTIDDLYAVLGIRWWQFELSKTSAALELGVMERHQFQRIERYEFSKSEAAGVLKVACQEGRLGEFRLFVLTNDASLLLAETKKPADFVKTHGTAVKKGEFFELMQFKGPEDQGWRYALVLRIVGGESKK